MPDEDLKQGNSRNSGPPATQVLPRVIFGGPNSTLLNLLAYKKKIYLLSECNPRAFISLGRKTIIRKQVMY